MPVMDSEIFKECSHAFGDQKACIFFEIMEKINTGIIILDLGNERVFFKNKHAEKIFKSVKEETSFQRLYSLLGPEIEEQKKTGTSRRSRTKKIFEHRVLGYSIYRSEDDNRFILVLIRDITDRIRLDSIDEATEMMNNIGYVFSAIRHEIGNPLNSIKMALTVLRNNVYRYSADEREVYFNRIFGEITKLEVLLKSFKHFSMFEMPHTVPLDLDNFFAGFLQLIGGQISSKKIDVFVDLPLEARMVNADARVLQHVVMNIIVNAIDAMEFVIEPSLTIRSFSDDNVVRLCISDNGCGMDEELLADIFKPFYTTKPDGTGLGLVISKKMLAQMNSSIEVCSEKGTGTSVTLTIPRIIGASEEQLSAVS